MNDIRVPLFKVFMAPDAPDRVAEVLRSGYIGEGPVSAAFEAAIGEKIGSPHVAVTSSGTMAIQIACRMCATPGKDEMLVCPLTCTATVWAILAAGSRPRWVDVQLDTGNIDPDDALSKVSPRTAAIMAVHWGGNPCNLRLLRDVQIGARQQVGYMPPVIEDAAHAWGATYSGEPLGNHDNFVCYSFQAIKTLTAGDGGAIVCPDAESCQRARLLRWFGLDRTSSQDFRCSQNVSEFGYKGHLNDVAAAVGLANLPHVDALVARQRQNADWYDQHLPSSVQPFRRFDGSSCWLYTLRAERRDDLKRYLAEHGIASSPVHRRVDLHDCVSQYREHLPMMDRLDREMLCLPVGWWMTDEQREEIAALIQKGW